MGLGAWAKKKIEKKLEERRFNKEELERNKEENLKYRDEIESCLRRVNQDVFCVPPPFPPTWYSMSIAPKFSYLIITLFRSHNTNDLNLLYVEPIISRTFEKNVVSIPDAS